MVRRQVNHLMSLSTHVKMDSDKGVKVQQKVLSNLHASAPSPIETCYYSYLVLPYNMVTALLIIKVLVSAFGFYLSSCPK